MLAGTSEGQTDSLPHHHAAEHNSHRLQRHRVLREHGSSRQRISDEVSVMEEVLHDVWGQGVAQRRRASLDPRRYFPLQQR